MSQPSIITYHTEDIECSRPVDTLLTAWLTHVAGSHAATIVELTYIFCSDDYLLEVNQTHLDHDYYTDIITFPYRQGSELEGDIFISVDRVADNAESYGVDYLDELLRVMAHGLLHLVGYGDKTKEEARLMREHEEAAISIYHRSTAT